MLDKGSMKKRNNMVVNYYLAKAFEKLDLPEQALSHNQLVLRIADTFGLSNKTSIDSL